MEAIDDRDIRKLADMLPQTAFEEWPAQQEAAETAVKILAL
jgi:hypothetical protein